MIEILFFLKIKFLMNIFMNDEQKNTNKLSKLEYSCLSSYDKINLLSSSVCSAIILMLSNFSIYYYFFTLFLSLSYIFLIQKMNNYEQLEVVYQSNNSLIIKVRSLQDNNLYVIKQFVTHSNPAIQEIKLHQSITNSFILPIHSIFQDSSLNMVLAYCDLGDMQQFIYQHQGSYIPQKFIARTLVQLTYILLHMNHVNFLHRAIIPENILVTSKFYGEQIRLTDFSMAGTDPRKPTIPAFLPPETINQNKFTQKSQVWQMGHILYLLASQKPLFQESETEIQISDILQKSAISLSIPPKYSKHLQYIIKLTLEIKESKRPSIKQLVQTTSFKKLKTYFQLSYEEEKNFENWAKPSLEELGKKMSIVVPQTEEINQFKEESSHTQKPYLVRTSKPQSVKKLPKMDNTHLWEARKFIQDRRKKQESRQTTPKKFKISIKKKSLSITSHSFSCTHFILNNQIHEFKEYKQ